MTGKPYTRYTALADIPAEEGIVETRAEAHMRAIVWELRHEMERQGISLAEVARRMGAKPLEMDRLFKVSSTLTLRTLQRAAAALGRELRLKLV